MIGPTGEDHLHLRLSDAERERAVALLQRSMSEGRLTLAEFDERTAAVYAAVTRGDLIPLLADLPAGAAVALPGAAQQPALQLRAEISTVKRTGDWQVPSRLELTTSMGTIHLDLSQCTALPPVIQVDVSTGMGTVMIVLPRGCTADVNGVKSSWGTVKSKVPAVRGDGRTHLVCTGSAGMGKFAIRYPSKKWF